MPRSFIKRRRVPIRRRRRFSRRGPSWMTMARKAWRGVKIIRGLVNVELKTFDTAISQNVTDTGSVTLVSNIAAGDDVQNRNGNSILFKQLFSQLQWTIGASATATFVREIFFIDMQNTGSAPAVTDVLQSASPASPLNVDTMPRWNIISDKRLTLNTSGFNNRFSKVFRKKHFHIKYTGTGSGTGYTNAIYLLLITNEPTNDPNCTGTVRIRFIDN